MNYIYGQLNQKIVKVEYEGEQTSTSLTNVDNKNATIGVDVRCVPYSLLVNDGITTYNYNGSEPIEFTLHNYTISKLDTPTSEENIYEYVLINENGEVVGDTISIPAPISSVELTPDEGHFYLDFYTDGTLISRVLADDFIMSASSGDGYIQVVRRDNDYVISLDVEALKGELNIPSKTSDLTNDSDFITSSSLPTKLSDLTNDEGFITIDSVPTKVSDLTNDAGFITDASVPTKVSELTNDSGFITSSSLPTKTSDLTNDSGFITSDALDGYATEQWVEDKGYITSEDIPSVDQTFDGTSTKAQSGVAIKTELDKKQNNLTESQQDAVDSGIDAFKVATFSGYGTAITALQSGKQNNLIPGTNIDIIDNVISSTLSAGTNVLISSEGVISATDTTYSAGEGLSLEGTQFSVDTTTIATKGDLELKQDTLTREQLDAVNSGITSETISSIENTLATKQDELTAGDGIEISEENVISVTDIGTTYDAGYGIVISDSSDEEEPNPTISIDDEVVAVKSDLATKQDTLVAGTGITIDENNVISADVGTLDYNELINKPIINIEDESGSDEPTYIDGEYYKIDGTIAKCEEGELTPIVTQNDLEEVLTTKQDTLIQGNNIIIEGSEISAIDTTYDAGYGITIDDSSDEEVVPTINVDTSVIATKESVDSKQDALDEEQLAAVNSGITEDKVVDYDNHLNNDIIHITEDERDLWNQNHMSPEGQVDVVFNADVPPTVESIPLDNILVGDTNYKVSNSAPESSSSGGSGIPTAMNDIFLNKNAYESLYPHTVYNVIGAKGTQIPVVERDVLSHIEFNTLSDLVFDNLTFSQTEYVEDSEMELCPIIRFVSDDLEWRLLRYTTTEPMTPIDGQYWMSGTTLYRYVDGDWQVIEYVTGEEPQNPQNLTYWLDDSNKLRIYTNRIRNLYALKADEIFDFDFTLLNYHYAYAHGESQGAVETVIRALNYVIDCNLQRYNGSSWEDVTFVNSSERPTDVADGTYWLSLTVSLGSSYLGYTYKQKYQIEQYTNGSWSVVKDYTQASSQDRALVPSELTTKSDNPQLDDFYLDVSGDITLHQYFVGNGWKQVPITKNPEDVNKYIPYYNVSTRTLKSQNKADLLLYTNADYFETKYGDAYNFTSNGIDIVLYMPRMNEGGLFIGGYSFKEMDLNVIGSYMPSLLVPDPVIDEYYSQYRIEKIYQNKFVESFIYRTFEQDSSYDMMYINIPNDWRDGPTGTQYIALANTIGSVVNNMVSLIPNRDTDYIDSSWWGECTSYQAPFKYWAGVELSDDFGEASDDKRVELVCANNDAILFAKYGFSILNVTQYRPKTTYSETPTNPSTGDYWYDNGSLKVYNGSSWDSVSNYSVTTLMPENGSDGDVWLDTESVKVWVWESNERAVMLIGALNKPNETVRITYNTYGKDYRVYSWAYSIIDEIFQ